MAPIFPSPWCSNLNSVMRNLVHSSRVPPASVSSKNGSQPKPLAIGVYPSCPHRRKLQKGNCSGKGEGSFFWGWYHVLSPWNPGWRSALGGPRGSPSPPVPANGQCYMWHHRGWDKDQKAARGHSTVGIQKRFGTLFDLLPGTHISCSYSLYFWPPHTKTNENGKTEDERVESSGSGRMCPMVWV